VSQISLPVRIILIGAVVFLAAWFTVLKPKPVEIEPTVTTPAPKTTGLGKAVDKAKAAAGQDTKPATEAATTSAPDVKPETPAVAIPAEALAKLPKDVARALEARKVLVLGVLSDESTGYRPAADDDRYVRNALRDVNRYDGDVFVKHVGITKLSTYGPLVNDLHVNQSPSVVVIDGNLKGAVLTGYVDRISINQVIADARDATTEPDITDPFLQDVNALCGRFELRVDRWSLPTVRGKRPAIASLERLIAVGDSYHRGLSRIDAPAKWRSLKADMLTSLAGDLRSVRAMRDAAKQGDKVAFDNAVRSLGRNDVKGLDRRFDEAGLTECASNRRS
jgi:hypothetical protein